MAASLDFPALDGRPVTEAHVRDCRENGHAGHTVNGELTGICPRCGEVTEAVAAPELAEITAGTPATIHYYTDSRAAVVTRRTAKRVYVARVETTNERNERDQLAAGELPVRIADGVLDRPLGPPEAYTLYVDSAGEQYATKGDKSIRVRFGRSITRVDYKL